MPHQPSGGADLHVPPHDDASHSIDNMWLRHNNSHPVPSQICTASGGNPSNFQQGTFAENNPLATTSRFPSAPRPAPNCRGTTALPPPTAPPSGNPHCRTPLFSSAPKWRASNAAARDDVFREVALVVGVPFFRCDGQALVVLGGSRFHFVRGIFLSWWFTTYLY